MAATNVSIAVTKAASEAFMSAAPRPYSQPSRSTGTNGSDVHCSRGPVGTTSVCPAKQTSGPRVAAPRPEIGDAAHGDRLAAKAQRCQAGRQQLLAAGVVGRDRRAGRSVRGSGQRWGRRRARRQVPAGAPETLALIGPMVANPAAAAAGRGPAPAVSGCGRAARRRCAATRNRCPASAGRGAPLASLPCGHVVHARRRRLLVDEPGEVGRRVGRGHRLVVGQTPSMCRRHSACSKVCDPG